MDLLLLHGPNLNLLGRREPQVYGRTDLAAINSRCAARAAAAGHRLTHLQSNAEHVLIERVHAAADDGTDFIVINPGGFTHTSVALRDDQLLDGAQVHEFQGFPCRCAVSQASAPSTASS